MSRCCVCRRLRGPLALHQHEMDADSQCGRGYRFGHWGDGERAREERLIDVDHTETGNSMHPRRWEYVEGRQSCFFNIISGHGLTVANMPGATLSHMCLWPDVWCVPGAAHTAMTRVRTTGDLLFMCPVDRRFCVPSESRLKFGLKFSQQRNPNRRGIWNSKRQIDVMTF